MSNCTTEIRKDIQALAQDARDLAVDTGHLAGEQVGAVRERLSGALDSAQQLGDRVRQKAVGRVKATDKVFRDHPYQTIGIAMGIGVFLGLMLTRCKNGSSTIQAQEKTPSP